MISFINENILTLFLGIVIGVITNQFIPWTIKRRNKSTEKDSKLPSSSSSPSLTSSSSSSSSPSSSSDGLLLKEFQRACQFMKQFKAKKITNEQKLELYGLFKQSLEGDCQGDKPSAFDFVASAKYDIWKKNSGMSQRNAQINYIKYVKSMVGDEYQYDEGVILDSNENSHQDATDNAPESTERQQSQQVQNDSNDDSSCSIHPSQFSSISDYQRFYNQFAKAITIDQSLQSIQVMNYDSGLSNPIRMYLPSQLEGDTKKTPFIVYLHGGGFVAGNLDTDDQICRLLCQNCSSIIASLSYCTSSEVMFPSSIEDCYEIIEHIFENHEGINKKIKEKYSMEFDPNHIGICGYDAGATLASCLCIMMNDISEYQFSFQILLCPLLSPPCSTTKIDKQQMESSKSDLEVKREYKVFGNYLSQKEYNVSDEKKQDIDHWKLTLGDLKMLWNQYATKEECDLQNPYLSPLYSSSFDWFPKSLIISAQNDCTRDEAEDFADILKKHKVQVFNFRVRNSNHYFLFDSKTDTALETIKRVGDIVQYWSKDNPNSLSDIITKESINQALLINGRKWIVENQKSNQGKISIHTDTGTSVELKSCSGIVAEIMGRVSNAITVENCSQCRLLINSEGIEKGIKVKNCTDIYIQIVNGLIPDIHLDYSVTCVISRAVRESSECHATQIYPKFECNQCQDIRVVIEKRSEHGELISVKIHPLPCTILSTINPNNSDIITHIAIN